MRTAPFGSNYARCTRPGPQRGQAALLVVMVVGIAATLLIYGMIDTTSAALRRDQSTAVVFAEVKRALIGWSVQRTPSVPLPDARPGELPCPDMNNDGFEDGTCAAGAIGRVPWKTLGIPEPKDAAGETLWYAIAGPFRIFTVNTNPIHSDTKGNLTVNQGDYNVVTEVYSVVSTITSEAVAVVFSPGAALGAQNRDCTGDPNVPSCQATRVCTGPTYTLTARCNPANYLESAAGINNSTTNGPFISAPSSYKPPPGFNDKVMAITTADLMPIVEQRVAREVIALLNSYKAAIGVYPWADCSNGASDIPVPPGDPAYPDGNNRGRFPSLTAYPVNWGSGGAPTPPNWLSNQGATLFNWGWAIHYAVGKIYLQGGGVDCGSCEIVGTGSPPSDGSLSVNGAFGKEVVIIMTGPAGASRPLDGLGSGICSQAQWAAYLDDGANNDLSNDRYVTPSSTTYARDRIYTIP